MGGYLGTGGGGEVIREKIGVECMKEQKRHLGILFFNQIRFTPQKPSPKFFFTSWAHSQTRKILFLFGRKREGKKNQFSKITGMEKINWFEKVNQFETF